MFWQNYPLIRLIIPFTLGMIGANLFMSHMNMVVLFILCCVVLSFSFFFIKTSDTYKDGKFGMVAMLLFFLIGMTLYTGKHQRTVRGIPSDTTFCCGILTEPPTKKAHSWTFNLKQENGTHIILYVGQDPLCPSDISPIMGRTIRDVRNKPHGFSLPITGEGWGEGLSIGDTILANIRHLSPTHLCENDTFRTYNTYLFHQGICATAYTPPNQWWVLPCQNRRNILTSAKALQEQLHDIYDDHGIQGEAGSIVEAMTIGRKTDLSKDTRNTYANAGISHILALSGFHVGIILLMIQVFFFKNVLPLRWQWVRNLFIIATLWCYALLTGMSPSLVRATTMFTILLFCQSFTHELVSINSCALAFFIMLCINPFYLNDVGFQLSFVSVAAISLFSQHILTSCPSHHNIVRFLWSIIFITLICTLFTTPLVAYHFGRIPLFSILSNLSLTLFVYLLLWASILWWLFLWCDPINSLLTDLLNWTSTTMNTLTERLASIPFATIEWHPNVLTTLLCYVALLSLTYFITHPKPKR